MKRETQYQIVGKVDCGNTTDYLLADNTLATTKRYTREQLIYLVAKGKVTNCKARLDEDKIVLVGKGISLKDLPTYNGTNSLSDNSVKRNMQRDGHKTIENKVKTLKNQRYVII